MKPTMTMFGVFFRALISLVILRAVHARITSSSTAQTDDNKAFTVARRVKYNLSDLARPYLTLPRVAADHGGLRGLPYRFAIVHPCEQKLHVLTVPLEASANATTPETNLEDGSGRTRYDILQRQTLRNFWPDRLASSANHAPWLEGTNFCVLEIGRVRGPSTYGQSSLDEDEELRVYLHGSVRFTQNPEPVSGLATGRFVFCPIVLSADPHSSTLTRLSDGQGRPDDQSQSVAAQGAVGDVDVELVMRREDKFADFLRGAPLASGTANIEWTAGSVKGKIAGRLTRGQYVERDALARLQAGGVGLASFDDFELLSRDMGGSAKSQDLSSQKVTELVRACATATILTRQPVVEGRLNRKIYVPQWGKTLKNVESYVISNHQGAISGAYDGGVVHRALERLVGTRRQKTSAIGGSTVLFHLASVLPPRASNIEYYDLIGNISTSQVFPASQSTTLLLEPRFPVYGTWGADFHVAYSQPMREAQTLHDDETSVDVTSDDVHSKNAQRWVAISSDRSRGVVKVPVKGVYDVTWSTRQSVQVQLPPFAVVTACRFPYVPPERGATGELVKIIKRRAWLDLIASRPVVVVSFPPHPTDRSIYASISHRSPTLLEVEYAPRHTLASLSHVLAVVVYAAALLIAFVFPALGPRSNKHANTDNAIDLNTEIDTDVAHMKAD